MDIAELHTADLDTDASLAPPAPDATFDGASENTPDGVWALVFENGELVGRGGAARRGGLDDLAAAELLGPWAPERCGGHKWEPTRSAALRLGPT